MEFTKEQLPEGYIEYSYAPRTLPCTEAPGSSVFDKNQKGEIFEAHSAYARGMETTIGTFSDFD